ncbi:putative late blight resistance protein homolog R1B-11 [Coffea arabica]|uniref:Late blight resistance protein homolog R1B-11 n=1 Tax=Coffea arabica TaxID=13443 RepID=A0ABM4V9L8_COFAR
MVLTRHLGSTIFVDNEHCMETLEHIFNYLPDYLKSCPLYLGAFQEDRDILVRKLLWLWISERFVQKTEGKSLEDVADIYLMDLIGRSLVMPTQRRSLGGIKVCQIHDLIRRFVGYEFGFPMNLRKLTLSEYWPRSKLSAIGKLPNDEVLKLYRVSFVGEKWEMEEGEFRNLRFLELSHLDIRWWEASPDNFCSLEKLVLKYCYRLKEVPSCLGEALTLDMIEVNGCCESAVNSVKQIQKEQMDMGNKDLKIVIIASAKKGSKDGSS